MRLDRRAFCLSLAAPFLLPTASARPAAQPVILVLFSLPGCQYCQVVREEHLPEVQRDARWRGRVDIIEVDMSTDLPLARFPGKTGRSLAAAHGVKIAPTVMAMDTGGQALGRPIVGAKLADFYGYYLEDLLEAALAAQGLR